MGWDAVLPGMYVPTFRVFILPPSSGQQAFVGKRRRELPDWVRTLHSVVFVVSKFFSNYVAITRQRIVALQHEGLARSYKKETSGKLA